MIADTVDEAARPLTPPVLFLGVRDPEYSAWQVVRRLGPLNPTEPVDDRPPWEPPNPPAALRRRLEETSGRLQRVMVRRTDPVLPEEFETVFPVRRLEAVEKAGGGFVMFRLPPDKEWHYLGELTDRINGVPAKEVLG